MTPKEKSEELVYKFQSINVKVDDFDLRNMSLLSAKECALICVDEQIILNGDYYLENKDSKIDYTYYCKKNMELFQIKQEIEKL